MVRYTGVRCRSKQHGVWALLVKQFWLGMSRWLGLNGFISMSLPIMVP